MGPLIAASEAEAAILPQPRCFSATLRAFFIVAGETPDTTFGGFLRSFRCLRRILGVPAASVCRVSNAAVLARAGAQPLEQQLRRSQMGLLAKAAQAQAGSAVRRNVFLKDTLKPVVGHFIGRIGRPRQAWTTSLMHIGVENCKDNFEAVLRSRTSWKHW